jgi:hypothetical protein
MKNKYLFFKKMYKGYVVMLESKGKLKTFGVDEKIMQQGVYDCNYVIVYSDLSIKEFKCNINNYYMYYIKYYLIDLLDNYKITYK